jgi:serine/threonine-protein kinase
MTARIPFEGDVLGDIVIKVCASPLPVPSQLEPRVPAGFDAWFARACSRDPAKRFQSATELAESLANVCGVGRVRMASQDEAKVQYMLKRTLTPLESIPVPAQSMSPKTAMLAGIVLGVTAMIGLAGALAFREKEQSQAAASAQPTASSPTARPSPLATAGDAGSRDAR